MDSFTIACRICQSIDKRKDLSKHEKAFVKTIQFFGCASNSGRLYPYLYHIEDSLWYLKEVGLDGTVGVVFKLREMIGSWNFEHASKKIQNQIEDNYEIIEEDAEGDFAWADPIVRHIQTNRERYPHIQDESFA